MQRAAHGPVQRVADHRGAVGGVVVVAVARVLRARTPGQRLLQRACLRRGKVQPLDVDAAAGLAVLLQVLLQWQRDQVVAHVAGGEAADEARFAGVEETEVVRGRLARARVEHHDGVMAEALEEHFAGLHRRHADARCGVAADAGGAVRSRVGRCGHRCGQRRRCRRIRRCGLREGQPGPQGQQQSQPAGRAHARHAVRAQAPSCAGGGRMVTWNACTRRASAFATRNANRPRVSSSPVSGRCPIASVTSPPTVS
ncbi:hypothetical protein NB705_002361 [Xanthomonas sacchari]|nr:hypothetical protein [Xanthomonas sacchari]